MTNAMSKNYRIIAKCDPYNAKKHYNGQTVVKYDGTTPISWVIMGELTEAQAKEELMKLAKTGEPFESGMWVWEDEDVIAEDKKAIFDITGEEADMSFYVGAGVYDGTTGKPVLLVGENSFWDDSVNYCIEEY